MAQELKKECTRCGTCCAKGGPALHREDLSLLEKGVFHRKDLMTLRQGEIVRNNVTGNLEPLEEEIVKLRGRHDKTWTCCFLNIIDRLCFIYKDRPVECRTLDCWNTEEIEGLYDHDRITRADIIGENNGLAEMVDVHEMKCDYERLAALAADIDTEAAREEYLEIIRFDIAFRRIVQEKAGIQENELDFLFGRSLADTAYMYGLEVTFTEAGPQLSKKAS